MPLYDELIYVTRPDLSGRSAPSGRFLAAVEEATVFITNHPEEAQGDVHEVACRPRRRTEPRRLRPQTLPRFAKRPAALDAGRYDRFAAFLKEQGLLDTVPPVETLQGSWCGRSRRDRRPSVGRSDHVGPARVVALEEQRLAGVPGRA